MADTKLVCMFHLNLAYSSIEEEARPTVIGRCYWPALRLAEETGFPIAIEATGWTLAEIAGIDPSWIDRCRELIADGLVEIVGSSWSQAAAPLLPAEANTWNLRLGREAYATLLGAEPRVALVSEQAYSPGLVPLFAETGYEAIIADWDNAFRSHTEWPDGHRRYPQRALGGGATLPVIWSQSIAFQKFQRYAHGDLPLAEYVDFVRAEAAGGGALLLYANDAEVFDHRPGRFAAEPALTAGEWERIGVGLNAMRAEGIGDPALPSAFLELLDEPGSGHELRLEAAAEPVPTKKQDKYNVGRWGATGRDDIGVNTRCWRIYDLLRRTRPNDSAAWRELCELWASDFRTHITAARWETYLERLDAVERRLELEPPATPTRRTHNPASPAGDTLVALDDNGLHVRLNARRGLALHAFGDDEVHDAPLVGTVPHGYFRTIDLGADWYTGTLVQEAPLRHKVADLRSIDPITGVDEGGRPFVTATIATELGDIEKTVTIDRDSRSVEIAYTLWWPELPLGSLRAGYVTLLPGAFDQSRLWYATHDGGRALSRQRTGDAPFDHGQAVSQLVSSRQGLGVTEGMLLLGDDRLTVTVEVDQAVANPLALITFRPAPPSFLLRSCFTLTEQDETRRGPIPRNENDPQRLVVRIGLRRGETP